MAENQQSMTVNLTGVAPVDVMMADPPGGPHEVEILAQRTETNPKNGKTSLRIAVVALDCGVQTQVVIGTDWSKAFNLGHLRNLLGGLHDAQGRHLADEKLTGMVDVGAMLAAAGKGLRGYIYVKPPPEGEIDEETGRAKRADKNFVTKSQFEAAKKAATLGVVLPTSAPAKAAPATANGTPPAPTGATPTPPAAPKDLGDLFAQ